MTPYLLDSGFLYALVDENDSSHQDVLKTRSVINGTIILPVPAITEVCYFVQKKLGIAALTNFLENLAQQEDFIFETPLLSDYSRSAEILKKYNDSNIDFVDGCIVAIAERLNITKILTVDRRHFQMFRPTHCKAFEILP